jgi:hypothetical protein
MNERFSTEQGTGTSDVMCGVSRPARVFWARTGGARLLRHRQGRALATRARLRGARGRGQPRPAGAPGASEPRSGHRQRDAAARGPPRGCRVSQTANGLRVKMHDKHGQLVSIGKHLGMFVDQVQIRARYAISDQPMSAEEWKKQYVREG